MKNRKLLLIVSLVLAMTMSLGGTLAYLTDTDGQVNVMTVGRVSIEQHEYERMPNAEGGFEPGVKGTDFKADYGIDKSYKLQEFTQGKPALPAVYQEGLKWDDNGQQLWNQVGAPGSNDLFDDSVKNVIDKFVFVENTGKTDAYFRTLIAIEWPEDMSKDLLHTSFNTNSRYDGIKVTDDFTGEADKGEKSYYVGNIAINGVNYLLYNMTHNEILKPGDVARPSLLQVFLDPMATNEDVAKLGDTWEILTVSQAVQADGFENAQTALNTAFGPVDLENKMNDVLAWFGEIGLVNAAPATGVTRPSGYGVEVLEQANPVVDGITVIDNSDEKTNLRALYAGDGNKFKGTLTVQNSYLDGTYAMNAIGDDTGDLIVKDTALRGWVSYDGFNKAEFTNCTFGVNSNPEYYNAVRPYSAVTFTDCEFTGTEFWLDKMGTESITFVNCTMNGKLIDDATDVTVVYAGGNIVIDNE